MYVVGITGSICSGKTIVAQMFKDLGAAVLDADVISHKLTEKSGKCFGPIVKLFGVGILTDDRIDRKKLSKIVFNDKTKLKQLEGIIHPEVKNKILENINKLKEKGNKKVLVIDVPLLFESEFDKLVDHSIVIKAPKETQILRALSKFNISRADVLSRFKAQMPLKKKIRLSDFIIDNGNEIETTKKQVKKIWQKLMKKKKK